MILCTYFYTTSANFPFAVYFPLVGALLNDSFRAKDLIESVSEVKAYEFHSFLGV